MFRIIDRRNFAIFDFYEQFFQYFFIAFQHIEFKITKFFLLSREIFLQNEDKDLRELQITNFLYKYTAS